MQQDFAKSLISKQLAFDHLSKHSRALAPACALFRQRCAMLLEAALRTAVACRNHALSKTVVETVGLFKIGCPPPGDVDWFNKLMMKQYQCLPRLKVDSISVECQGENEMATGDVLTLALARKSFLV